MGDIRYNGIGDRAQLATGMKILGVNGNVFSGDALLQALDDTKGNTKPIHLIVQSDTALSDVTLDYHDGQRYPVLQRVDGTPALLDDVTKPLTPAPAK